MTKNTQLPSLTAIEHVPQPETAVYAFAAIAIFKEAVEVSQITLTNINFNLTVYSKMQLETTKYMLK